MVNIKGEATGTRRFPTITLTMPKADGEKLMFVCRFTSIIAEAMEFMGMRHKAVVRLLEGLKKGLNEAGINGG